MGFRPQRRWEVGPSGLLKNLDGLGKAFYKVLVKLSVSKRRFESPSKIAHTCQLFLTAQNSARKKVVMAS